MKPTEKNGDPQFMSPQDLRELLGFGETKTYKIFQELPTYKFGKALRVKRSDLENWIESNRRNPKDD